MPICIACHETMVALYHYQTGERIFVDLEASEKGNILIYDADHQQYIELTEEDIIEAKRRGLYLLIEHSKVCRPLNNIQQL